MTPPVRRHASARAARRAAPGHTATHNLFPHIFARLGVENLGPAALELESVFKHVEGWFHLRTWKPDAREARTGR